MSRNEYLILFLAASFLEAAYATPECDSWGKIKRSLKDKFSINCTVVDDCIGLFCNGFYQGYDISVKTEIKPCEEPVEINFILDIPKTNVRNVSQSLRDGNEYDIPDITGHAMHLFLAVSLKEEKAKALTVGITMKSRETGLLNLPIISNGTIVRAKCKISTQRAPAISILPTASAKIAPKTTLLPVPQVISTKTCKECGENETCETVFGGVVKCECKKGFVSNGLNECRSIAEGERCNFHELEQCKETEKCVRIDPKNQTGICVCREHYHPDTHHSCIPDDPLKREPSGESVALILSIVLPISFLLLCSACVFVVVKQRIIQRIRERYYQVRTYEVVAIGNDDDDEPLVA